MKGEEYRDKRVYALLQRAESAINNGKGKSKSYHVAWYVIHGTCKPYATLNDVKRDIEEYWLRVSHHVVSESTKREFQKILDSLVPTFDNTLYQFPDEIVHIIEQEMHDMKRFKRRPNYISVRAGNGGSMYDIVRVTLHIDAKGKKRLGNSSTQLYSVDRWYTAECITDALTACAFTQFQSVN